MTIRLSSVTLALALCIVMARSAGATSITASITVGYNGQTRGGPPTNPCSNTQSFVSTDAFSFSVGTGSCPFSFGTVFGNFGPLSGILHAMDCDGMFFNPNSGGPICSADVVVEGDYYFPGSGIATFAFGAFSDAGIESGPVRLWIDGGSFQFAALFGNTVSPMVTMQLGEIHHLRYENFFISANQDGGFFYNFATPGIDITALPEPGSGMLVLAVIPVFILLRRAAVRLSIFVLFC
jgi:hypothetical protein